MGRKLNLDYLVGAAEIAQRLDVKKPHLIHDWRRRYPEFPKPIVELTGILLWDWRDVKCWALTTNRIEP